VLALLVLFECKPKEQPDDTRAKATSTTTSPSAPAASVSAAASASVQATIVDAAIATVDAGSATSVSGDVHVSSRSDDPKSSPLAMFDGDDATSWSPAAGDATPTIVFKVDPKFTRMKTKMQAILLATTGVLEVKVTWKPRADTVDDAGITRRLGYGAEQTLAERVAVDPTATGLQRIAAETSERGVVTLTIVKSVSGATVAVRELKIETDDGSVLRPTHAVVGDGKPRGISAIVPEGELELGCVAAVNDPPRAYCFNGEWESDLPLFRRSAFVMIDASGAHVLRPLTFDFAPDARDYPAPHLRWADWLAIEKTLRDAGAVTLDKRRSNAPGAVDVPWGKTASAFGATLRQRETSSRADNFAPDPGGVNRSGVLEVQWPGATGFTSVMGANASLGGALAFARPLGSVWLVERMGSAEHSPGGDGTMTVTNYEARAFADASLCDPATKKCTTPYSSLPPSE